VAQVVGVGRSQANLARAVELGVIDSIAADAADALAGADLVLVAVPVQQTERVLNQIADHIEPGAAVTDGGSTKRDVIAAARNALGARLAQFVPAHPIAGAELSGVEAATAELYRGRTVVITPIAESLNEARTRVAQAWLACGARLVEMTAERHDAVLAAVSHLPHALAFALVDMIADRADGAELFSFAGAGFRDFTRIASSSPEMWRDICLANRDLVLAEVSAYRERLAILEQYLERADGPALERMFEAARTARNAWLRTVKS
jgi:prephenate dehydrogenase